MILWLSALAGLTVSGIYFWAAMPQPNVAAVPAGERMAPPAPSANESAFIMTCCVLFFATIYGTGMALYRFFGDAQGYMVVSATAGQHMPLLLLIAGGFLTGSHGVKVVGGSGRIVDWVMLVTGLALLIMCIWGFYRALFVHRKFYQWFYGSRHGPPPAMRSMDLPEALRGVVRDSEPDARFETQIYDTNHIGSVTEHDERTG
jgi:hypothetical protein